MSKRVVEEFGYKATVGMMDERTGEMPVAVATGLSGSMDQTKAYLTRLKTAVESFENKDLRRATGWSFKSSMLGDVLGNAQSKTAKATKWVVNVYEPWRKDFEAFLIENKASSKADGSMATVLLDAALEKKSASELWSELEKWEENLVEHQRVWKTFGFGMQGIEAGSLGYVGPLTVAKKVITYAGLAFAVGAIGYAGFRYWKAKGGRTLAMSERETLEMQRLRRMWEADRRRGQERRMAFPAAGFMGNDCSVCGAFSGDDSLCDRCLVDVTGSSRRYR